MNEVEDASILKTGPDARYRRSLLWLPRAPVSPPRSGLSRSDLVRWPTADQRVQRGMSATDKSRHSGSRAPLRHHYTQYPHTACSANMWCPIRSSDARHLGDTHGDTEGDTLGDTVSPSCIPQLACKFPHKCKALADRSASRINPDSPLGAPPLGLPSFHLRAGFIFPKIQCSYSDRSSPSWLSARWMSSLHWGHC